ncbi:MAG TPA: hypothetical protein VN828_24820, partial [Acidobacteriaceae bacterium]|nr:hypothetical protein [Acidobacteriaceae bacterium]
MGEASLGTPPSERPVDDRLDSWKEIAAYLNRDVTTVQRWEKREGMPVHRHLHDRMGSVYASRAELDAWALGRNLRATTENGGGVAVANPSVPEAEPVIEQPRTKGRLVWPLMIAAGVALVVGAVLWFRGTEY